MTVWDAFISHASEDTESVAGPLKSLLGNSGLRTWLDRDEMGPADSIPDKINQGLVFSRHALAIISDPYLSKPNAHAEFLAIVNRNIYRPGYLVPVLHQMSYQRLTDELPIIAQTISLNTEVGIDVVARQIADRIRIDRLSAGNGPRYFDSFELPSELIRRAIGAIEILRNPSSWEALSIRNDLSIEDTWMGSDERALIAVLFDLYRPLVFFRTESYRLRRTFSAFRIEDKQRLLLLETAFRALTHEADVAFCGVPLDYDPRTPEWRSKRSANPPQHWWQGLTEERFDEAAKFFPPPSGDSGDVALDAFISAYRTAFRGSSEIQRPLGLLANPLFGFTPATRPVYWRVLHIWLVCYTLIAQGPLERKLEATEISQIVDTLQSDTQEADESRAATMSSVKAFLDMTLIPRIGLLR